MNWSRVVQTLLCGTAATELRNLAEPPFETRCVCALVLCRRRRVFRPGEKTCVRIFSAKNASIVERANAFRALTFTCLQHPFFNIVGRGASHVLVNARSLGSLFDPGKRALDQEAAGTFVTQQLALLARQNCLTFKLFWVDPSG
eukprot:8593428-Pyramimonas_sp.AAC.2